MGNRSELIGFWRRKLLPVVLQTESAECGLACLAMVAGYWGHKIDLANLRRQFSVSLKGVNFSELIRVSRSLRLDPRPIKLELEHLRQVKLPCILHWGMNHFVVLKSANSRELSIHDPAIGVRRVSMSEAAKLFTGIALEFSPSNSFEFRDDTQRWPIRSLMGRVEGLDSGLAQLFLLGVVLQICVLVMPFYVQIVLDEAVGSSDRDLIAVMSLGFLLVIFLQVAITVVHSWLTAILSADLNLQWLNNVFGHLTKLSIEYFEKRHLGDIISRFNSIYTIQQSITTQLVVGLIDSLLVIGTFLIMLLYSVPLTAIAVAAVVLYGVLRVLAFRKLREATSESIIHTAKQQSYFIETVRGIRSVKLFDRADERRQIWANTLTDQVNADLLVAKHSISYKAAKSIIQGVENVAIVWLAAIYVLESTFSVGMLFAFLSFKIQFVDKSSAIVEKIFEWRMLRLHADRISDIVGTDAEEAQDHADSHVDHDPSLIEIRNVAFRYSDDEPYIVSNLNLEICKGQFLAITGASGKGKSTILKLLLGIVVPTKGEILIDGVNLRDFGYQRFRKCVGTVTQDDQLFSGSVLENISFFDPTPDIEFAKECSSLAAIHDEIVRMPMSYNTLIGDIGTGLSGGQKQRILIARALYKRPKFLFFDEATSELDSDNERAIYEAIEGLQLTRVIVAHRNATVGLADSEYVIK